jgi:hypothetical protein
MMAEMALAGKEAEKIYYFSYADVADIKISITFAPSF